MQTTPQTPSLWRNRDYLALWTGNAVSALGSNVSTIAFPLLVLLATGSVALAGVIGAAGMLGALTTTLLGGVLADRVSRKAIMVLAPIAQGAVLAVVAASVADGHSSVPMLAGAELVVGLVSGLRSGAAMPALRRIVSKEQIGAATAQGMGRDMAAEFVGAPLGGALFAVSRWFPFAADAVSFLGAALGALVIRRPLGPDASTSRSDGGSVLHDVRSGFRFVWGHPYLRFVFVWGSLVNVPFQAFALLLIALVHHRGGGPTTIGLVNSVALVGGIAGAVVAPVVLKTVRARLVLPVAAWMFAASVGVVAIAPRVWEIGTVLLFTMLTVAPLNVVLDSYFVRLVPDEMSGRVSAVMMFGAQALQWIGPLVAGALASAFGVVGGVLSLSVAIVPLALAIHLTKALTVLNTPVKNVVELASPARVSGDLQLAP